MKKIMHLVVLIIIILTSVSCSVSAAGEGSEKAKDREKSNTRTLYRLSSLLGVMTQRHIHHGKSTDHIQWTTDSDIVNGSIRIGNHTYSGQSYKSLVSLYALDMTITQFWRLSVISDDGSYLNTLGGTDASPYHR